MLVPLFSNWTVPVAAATEVVAVRVTVCPLVAGFGLAVRVRLTACGGPDSAWLAGNEPSALMVTNVLCTYVPPTLACESEKHSIATSNCTPAAMLSPPAAPQTLWRVWSHEPVNGAEAGTTGGPTWEALMFWIDVPAGVVGSRTLIVAEPLSPVGQAVAE